jgi:general secretion pathway protein J
MTRATNRQGRASAACGGGFGSSADSLRGATPIASAARGGGFTLIEVVLALTIFSLLTLMMYSAFYLGHRAVLKGERQANINQRMRLAEDVLGRQLRSAVFKFGRKDDESFPYFIGHSDGVSFVTSAPQSRGGTGLAVVTYRIANGRLLLEERVAFTPDDLFDPPNDAPVERAVLLTDFATMRFEYLPHEDPEMKWQSGWDARDEEMLPAAVRLTVDGLEFFQSHPWVRQIPLMTIAYGWGNDEFQEPPDEDESADEQDGNSDESDSNDDREDD